MRFITISHGINTQSIAVEDNTTASAILGNPTNQASLGYGSNVDLVDQNGNNLSQITPEVTSAQVINRGSTKG